MFQESRTAILCCLFLLTALIPAASAAALPGACDTPRPLMPSDVHRQAGDFAGESHCYRLELPVAGVWHLSLATPRNAGDAYFEIFDPAGRRAKVETFERSATERLTFVPPGSWFVHVRSEDPRRPVPAYRLSSGFAETARTELSWKSEEDGELEIESEGLKSEEDGELEIESEGLRAACGLPDGKSEEDGELEIESEGIVTGCGLGTAQLRQALCRSTDDHGDAMTCATPLGRRPSAELGNGWGDDVDVFRFSIGRWRTVEIATSGGLETRGALFDAAGQRLDTAAGDGFRLVRTLRPGTYYVQVSGDVPGSYELNVRRLDR